MATLNELARGRKAQRKQLLLASRTLDAAQESLEREIKRLVNRKQSVPELSDAQRLVNMAKQVEAALTSMVTVIGNVTDIWSAV